MRSREIRQRNDRVVGHIHLVIQLGYIGSHNVHQIVHLWTQSLQSVLQDPVLKMDTNGVRTISATDGTSTPQHNEAYHKGYFLSEKGQQTEIDGSE
jgi:hypothetical protein